MSILKLKERRSHFNISIMKTVMFVSILLNIVIITNCLRESVAPQTKNPRVLDVNMPGVRPTQDDHYLCTSLNVEAYGTQYIQSFKANSDADKAHHMLFFTCDDLDKEVAGKDWWDCGHHYNACRNMRIIYAWAKNAQPTILPKDVGFRIGPESNIKNLILQVHYAHPLPEGTQDTSGFRIQVTPEEPKFLAGILLLFRSSLEIPPHTDKIHGDMNCPLQTPAPIHPFAYRVHAHKLGVVISGYRMDQNGEFQQIGKGNPQWPQAFYPITKSMTIYPNDYLAARCTYSTTNFENATRIGQTAGDEMCNLYIMFYTESRDPEDHYLVCGDEVSTQITAHLPADSDVPLPRNITLEEHAHGHHTSPHSGLSLSQTTTPSKSHTKKRPGAMTEPHQTYDPEYPSDDSENNDRADGGRKFPESEYKVVTNWPDSSVKLGQATGVDFDTTGNVVVFHRGDRTWDSDTFDNQNLYKHRNLGPITQDTVLIIHPISGKILHQWGKDIFYMPHDVTVDKSGNFWLTDVAMHQVLKFEPGATGPSMILGTKFVPGNDDSHFCKPAAVAVLSNGDFFVADGYCNSRIIKFNQQGQKILQWGRAYMPSLFSGLLNRAPPPYAFQIPHALALAEDKNLLCVADRENGRIQCFNTVNGTFEFKIESPAFGGRLFSVAYSKNNGGYLYAVNGPSRNEVQGFVIPIASRQIQSVFKPSGGVGAFGNPHDVSVTPDGNDIYVVEISQPYKVWKFSKNIRYGKADQSTAVVVASDASKVPVIVSSPSKPAQLLEDPPTSSDTTRLAKDESFSASVIIMAFLTIPLLLLITIGALMRLMTSGWCRRRKDTKSFSEFFPPSAGFEKLKMDESDSENSDTDVEEFAVSSYRKVPT